MKQLINFTPAMDRVVVLPSKPRDKTDGGIYVPDTAELPLRGKIMAAGADSGFTPGDIVAYGKYAGTEILVDDKEYLIMRSLDVFGRFDFPDLHAD